MTTAARQRTNPITEMLAWLDADAPLTVPSLGLTPFVRVEDFVDDDAYVLRAEMPGIDPARDLDISIDGDVLTLAGERREEQRDRRRHEFHYGSFTRTVHLPRHARADAIVATYSGGVLELRVPLDVRTEQPTKVAVQRIEE